MPSIKLVELRRPIDKAVYKVTGLVDTAKWSIDQRLTKEDVTSIIDSGLYKVTINGEK